MAVTSGTDLRTYHRESSQAYRHSLANHRPSPSKVVEHDDLYGWFQQLNRQPINTSG